VTERDRPDVTGGEYDAGQEMRSVRRMFLVALAAALVAAGVTYAVELARSPTAPATPRPQLLPVTFSERGFADHVLDRVATVELKAGSGHGALQVADWPSGSQSLYVVARCSAGSIRVASGALSASQPCRGTAAGVVVLGLVHPPLRLDITATDPQPQRWAVGAYR
jgi:hypothetical protein